VANNPAPNKRLANNPLLETLQGQAKDIADRANSLNLDRPATSEEHLIELTHLLTQLASVVDLVLNAPNEGTE
jgi:hypothetical protein